MVLNSEILNPSSAVVTWCGHSDDVNVETSKPQGHSFSLKKKIHWKVKLQVLFQLPVWILLLYRGYYYYIGARTAQLVECQIEKPGTILTWVQVPLWGKGFFFQESTSSADRLSVSVQPSYAIACITICAQVKKPKYWQPYNRSVTQKYCTHW